MSNQTPEQIVRDCIDANLRQAGWAVHEKNKIDFSSASGIAINEYLTQHGQRLCAKKTAAKT